MLPQVEPVFDLHVHVGHTSHWIPEGLELARGLLDAETFALLEGDDSGHLGATLAEYLTNEGVALAAAIPVGRAAEQLYTLDEIEPSNGMLLPFVQFDPRSAPDAAEKFEDAIDRGAAGLKVHPCSHQLPPNDRSLYPLYEIARSRRIPIMIHIGSSVFPGAKMKFCDPLLVDEVAADLPDLQLICAHSGRGFWTSQVYSLARMRSNIWMELSGIPPKRVLEYFPEIARVGDRVLWGSDWPSSPPPSRLIAEMHELDLDAELVRAIMWDNAARLFRVDR